MYGAIQYNYLNLPASISATKDDGGHKGDIKYVYDAAGNKLQKIVLDYSDLSTNYITQTDYIGTFVYETKDFSGKSATPVIRGSAKPVLQYISDEEGRMRPRFINATDADPAGINFDYFIKDHLGNVRMVLTDEQKQDVYPVADVENQNTAAITTEKQYYDIVDGNIVDESAVPSFNGTTTNEYQNNNGNPPYNTNPNINPSANSTKLYKLNGASGVKTGLGITLKVMSGDVVEIFGKSYYHTGGATPNNNNLISNALQTFLGVIAGSAAVTASHTGVTGAVLNNNTGTSTPLISWLNGSAHTPANSNIPRAYINWIFLDEQFNTVTTGGLSGADIVSGTSDVLKSHYKTVSITKNGYLYVYCSNESDIDVFFDNLQVVHSHGPLVSEDHYYPFGLVQAGISSKALGFGDPENKRKFNKGSELQNKEFSDGSGLELYATNYRSLDPQLGRWWQIDPKPDYSQSLYSAMNNNPILYNDPLGDTLLIHYRKNDIVYNNGALTNKDGSAYGGKVKGFLKQTVNALNSGRTGSTEAASMIGDLQGSKNNFAIVKGTENKFDVNPSQSAAGYANQLKTDPNLAPSLAATPAAALQGGAGGTITWNPSGANVWVVGGGQDNNPTTNLMHELLHGRDANMGLLDNRLYNGLKQDEWQASYKENLVRQQMGLPIREYYRSQDNGGVITPLSPRLLDASNNPILPPWVPAGW